MVSLLSRGVGILVKSLAGLSCSQATRCSSHPSSLSLVQCVTTRWFSKRLTPGKLPQTPIIEDPPKRPLTSFLQFLCQQRPVITKQHPGASNIEIIKLAAVEWRSFSEVEKQVYIDVSRANTLKYRESVQNYKDKIGPLEWKALKERRRQKRERKKALKLRKEYTKYGKPKGLRSPFAIFINEHSPEAKGESGAAKLKCMAHEWRMLSSSDKQVYTQLAEDDKVRYKNEMKVWEDQMFEIGRHDLIRLKQRAIYLRKKSTREKALSEKEKSEKDPKTTSRKGSPKKHEE